MSVLYYLFCLLDQQLIPCHELQHRAEVCPGTLMRNPTVQTGSYPTDAAYRSINLREAKFEEYYTGDCKPWHAHPRKMRISSLDCSSAFSDLWKGTWHTMHRGFTVICPCSYAIKAVKLSLTPFPFVFSATTSSTFIYAIGGCAVRGSDTIRLLLVIRPTKNSKNDNSLLMEVTGTNPAASKNLHAPCKRVMRYAKLSISFHFWNHNVFVLINLPLLE